MSSPPSPGPPPPAPVWTAAAVARRLGVAPATLRSWSARYGIGPPDHRAGRYRRYTSTDLAELETVQRLRRDGMPMATAAAIARARRADLPGAARPGGDDDAAAWAAEVATVVSAVRALDADAAVTTLRAGLAGYGVARTWNRLCRPALARTAVTAPETGAACPGGPAGPGPGLESDPAAGPIDAECTLTWAITTSLRGVPPPTTPAPGARVLLLACAHGELHTLALDALLATLHEQQLPARMLGPSVPPPALRHAAENTRPAAVFVWAHTTHTARPATLHDLDRHAAAVVAAGPGWDPAALPGHVRTAHSLDEALAHARRATAAQPARAGAVRRAGRVAFDDG